MGEVERMLRLIVSGFGSIAEMVIACAICNKLF